MNDRFDVPSMPFDFGGLLTSYVAHSMQMCGHVHAEPPSTSHIEFQHDHDRIIHSIAFRRLEYKTQVFMNHEDSLLRTWLTYSLEVIQIARSIACGLYPSEDLVEAVSLVYDLGHTPSGHVRQDALNDCMKPYGSFEYNLQSLLVADRLEERYGGFDSLNLIFEMHEGIFKHCSRNNAATLGDLGRRFLEEQQLSLEAQLANLADEVAHNNRDIDDGLCSDLTTLEQLEDVPLWAIHRHEAETVFPNVSGRCLIDEAIRHIVNTLIIDLIGTTRVGITEIVPQCIDDVHAVPALAAFSAATHEEVRVLERFLFDNLCRHHLATRMSAKARHIIDDLFRAFMDDPRLLPPQYQVKVDLDEWPY